MADPQAPRVKLPAITPPRVNQGGSNSWAVSQGQQHVKTPTATNRDRYENKPMPPTPGPSPSSAVKPLTARKNRIQPVMPLVSSEPADNLNGKNRAATEPVMPKPLITSTTNTVNNLRKKYSQSKKASKASKDGDAVNHWLASPPPTMAHKASQILGVYPVKGNQRETPPASAPPSSGTLDPFRTSTDGTSGRSMSPSRQVHSTPVLTRRYLRENMLSASTGTQSSQESKEAPRVSAEGKEQARLNEETVTDDDSFNLTGFGMSGKQLEVEYVRQNEMQRVTSFSGVIEHPDLLHAGENVMQSNSARSDLIEKGLHQAQPGEVLRPTVYSSGNFAGVWENDPNVGRTLPPFSPFHPPPPPHPIAGVDQRAVSQTSGEVPIVLQRFPGESSYGSGYTRSLRSQNSWAPSGNGNSFAQAASSSSAAETTPRFPTHVRNNSVPPPPTSYPGFQPSGPLPPGLMQMELNLHHHIDNCFGSLMRLTTDNIDRAIDKVVRRVDDLQEAVERGFKNLRSELKDVRKDMSAIRRDNVNGPKASENLKDSIDLLQRKLDQIDQKINDMESHNQQGAADASESERGVSSAYSQDQSSPHRRLEGLRISAMSRQEQRQPYPSGIIPASANTQNNISIGHRSRRSTTSESGGVVRGNGERSTTRREMVIAQLGAVNAPVPDIREHPAYRGVIEGHGQSSPIYHTPNYSEIWYQQAYGDRH
ncbi:MAG: hypothetical protein LQ352_001233 [Teloschistes flavicans]|nr:MAG: hypothetical protein LQ352_001233 [Teloschistes flavicans]